MLPDELIFYILEKSDYQDILNLCVNHQDLNRFCRDSRLWWSLIRRDYGDYLFLFTDDYKRKDPRQLYLDLKGDPLINSPVFKRFYLVVEKLTGEIPIFLFMSPYGSQIQVEYPIDVNGIKFWIRDKTILDRLLEFSDKERFIVQFTRDKDSGYIFTLKNPYNHERGIFYSVTYKK